jgi:hypothetical protein
VEASNTTIFWEFSPGANSRETGKEATQTIVEFVTKTGQLER